MRRKHVDIADIDLDGSPQMRASALDDEKISEYAENLYDLPPVDLVQHGKKYYVADGHHRVRAAIKAGDSKILAYVRKGDHRDALIAAASANATHGMPRTNADKRRAVTLLLLDDEIRLWSDGRIALAARVSDRFVAKLRAEVTTPNGSGLDEQPRVGADGKTRRPPKKKKKKAPPRPDASPPDLEPDPSPTPGPSTAHIPDDVREAVASSSALAGDDIMRLAKLVLSDELWVNPSAARRAIAMQVARLAAGSVGCT